MCVSAFFARDDCTDSTMSTDCHVVIVGRRWSSGYDGISVKRIGLKPKNWQNSMIGQRYCLVIADPICGNGMRELGAESHIT